MSLQVVPAAEWQRADEALLAKEKEATRARDALAAERRRLPVVQIDKDYVFDRPGGEAQLLHSRAGCRGVRKHLDVPRPHPLGPAGD
jgi:predicted dithiol-disulfide oxidoreductase (DUF899 family)